MLTVDLRLPDFEVRKIVREKCAKFGTVKQIRIVGDVDQDGQRYAFVEMSSRAATQSVALQVGDSRFGNATVIRLQHAKTAPHAKAQPTVAQPAALAARSGTSTVRGDA
jgi:hypothetical protein